MYLPLNVVDTFCGAGGLSQGLMEAADAEDRPVQLYGFNHNETAISTYKLNHRGSLAECKELQDVDPERDLPEKVHILIGGPSCTHHSNARSGKPRDEQSRASAWDMHRIAKAKRPNSVLLENVREFTNWGPLTKKKKPDKRYKGRYFNELCNAFEQLGYHVDFKIQVAANHGDPTTRARLIMMMRLNGQVTWPKASHTEDQWIPASQIIDFSIAGRSIFNRKRALAFNTLRRIFSGFQKFNGAPFTFQIDQTSGAGVLRPVSRPIGTVVTKENTALVQPYLIQMRGTSPSALDNTARSVGRPIPTVTAGGNHSALVQPYLVNMKGQSLAMSIGRPTPTITARAQHLYLAEPYLIKWYGTGGAVDLHAPMDTITTKDRFGLCLPEIRIDGDRYWLDILLRLLTPKELAAAMSFPADYDFQGRREEKVMQIGNAVPVKLARAHCAEQLKWLTA